MAALLVTGEYLVSQAVALADFLAQESGLAKARVKDCLAKGGVQVSRPGRRFGRCRKAKTALGPGCRVRLYYDPEILRQVPPPPRLIADRKEYSLWDKPAGLLAQGTNFGDHCSLLRLAETYFSPSRPVFLVHRLDREASGLMLIAHSRRAAAGFSRLWQSKAVLKQYQITVLGLWNREDCGAITLPLDGKEARTEYQLLAKDGEPGTSRLLVTLGSGRLHQIRRHFARLGFPVIGDPRYGQGNKDMAGLQLRAVRLTFTCPLTGAREDFRAPEPASEIEK